MLKMLKTTATISVLMLGALVTAPASAQHWHGGGGHVGFYFGGPLYAPYYYPPPYYAYPPAVYAPPAAPPVYIERSDMQAAPQSAQSETSPSSYWSYCADSNAYYPYVKNCASPWQRVSPQPPTAAR